MDVFEKIDKIFEDDTNKKPEWANEILNELKEIKSLLLEQRNKKDEKEQRSEHNSSEYYDFIKNFRVSMQEDAKNGIHNEFYYKDKKLSINFKGLLYDADTLSILPKNEAFEAYKFIYLKEKDRYNSRS